MRILIAHAHYRVAGGEDRYIEQQRELLSGDHDVTMLAERNEDLPGGPGALKRMVYDRRRIGEVASRIEAVAPDVIHLHNPYPALGPAVHLAARRLGIPLVQTVHNHRLRCPNGYMFTGGELCARCVRGNHVHALLHPCFPSKTQAAAYATALWTHRFPLHIDDAVVMFVAPSRYMAERLGEWGYPGERIACVPNFTDTDLPDRGPGTGGIFAGRLSPEKGIDVLLAALARAGDPPFTIVGSGPSDADLRGRARELGLARCRFAGVVSHDEVIEQLGAARYFVMPSLWHENAPLALMEAMALGRAPIVARRGGLPELAEGRGLVVEPDVESLTSAIAELEGDAERAARLGAAARDFARAELGPERHRARLEEVYATVTAPGG